MYCFQKEELGLMCDKLGFTSNTYDIRIEKELENYTFIYWLGETPHPAPKNRLLIFYRFPQIDIPSSQGKNWLKIQIGEMIYDRIGIYKTEGYSKHDYHINVKVRNDNLIINWRINNWYNSDIVQGVDTVTLKNN